jgi:ubiquinone/menaquinone biosynthesis C-methylase UbiE/acyl carrier protein
VSQDGPIDTRTIEDVLRDAEGVREAVVLPMATDKNDSGLLACIAPMPEGSAAWQSVFDDLYSTEEARDWRLDTRGWRSSIDGRAYRDDEMREWADASATRVLELRPTRVLEVGCGSGLLAWRIAPHVEEYVGLDFSPSAIRRLEATADRERIRNVTFVVRDANDLAALSLGAFDVVILNSVVQYLSTAVQLGKILANALRICGQSGAVYVGDVRDLRLLNEMHLEALNAVGASNHGAGAVLKRVRQRVASESELVIHPRFFADFAAASAPPTTVEMLPRRGRAHNEMTCFRYDVVLRRDQPIARVDDGRQLDLVWGIDIESLEGLEQLLLQVDRPFRIDGIPNARVSCICEQLRLLEGAPLPGLPAVDPEKLWQLAARTDRPAVVHLSPVASDRLSAMFGVAGGDMTSMDLARWGSQAGPLTNRPSIAPPLSHQGETRLIAHARAHADSRLPAHLVPDRWICVSSLPRLADGSVSRSTLMERFTSPQSSAPMYRGETETKLAELWQRVLGPVEFTRTTSFYEVGGDSLKAAVIAAGAADEFNVALPVTAVLDTPTVASLAEQIDTLVSDLEPS